MSNCFYQLWSVDQLKFMKSERLGDSYPGLSHTAGSRFISLGVAPGDYIYIWSYFDGGLHLASRLCAKMVTDDPSEISDDPDHLYKDVDHIRATEMAPLYFDLRIPNERVKELKFINATGEVTGVKYLSNGKINPQTFRGIRQITDETAELLDKLFDEKTEESGWNPKAIANFECGKEKYYDEDFEGALKDFNKAIRANPEYTDAYRHRSVTLWRLNKYKKAIEDCSWIIDRYPDDALAWYYRGDCRLRESDIPNAFFDLGKSVDLDPVENVSDVMDVVHGYLESYQEHLESLDD